MSQTRIFWKILFGPFERSHLVVTSCKKSRKLLEPFLSNLAKSQILGHFGPKRAHITRTRIFSEKPPCTFLALIVMNIHVQKLRNPQSGFFVKLLINYQLPTNGSDSIGPGDYGRRSKNDIVPKGTMTTFSHQKQRFPRFSRPISFIFSIFYVRIHSNWPNMC